ncbi:MAG: uridine kinase [Bdellovibrionales bacterium]|nr:uridine kinase [Bdellovibrionales bacterium]
MPDKSGALILGISGGSGSGKTTLARELAQQLGNKAAILYQDWYYRDQSAQFDFDGGQVNFDHPDALEFELMAEHLRLLRQGRKVFVPQYDFASHKRMASPAEFPCPQVVLVDGILILHSHLIRPLFHLSVFVETREDIRFQRRLARDVAERGRTPDGVKSQFTLQVKPMHDQFVEPSRIYADHVISGEEEFAGFIAGILPSLP